MLHMTEVARRQAELESIQKGQVKTMGENITRKKIIFLHSRLFWFLHVCKQKHGSHGN